MDVEGLSTNYCSHQSILTACRSIHSCCTDLDLRPWISIPRKLWSSSIDMQQSTSIESKGKTKKKHPNKQTNKQQQQHPFNGPLSGTTRWASTRKVKPIWIYWSKRQWVAVASAGPYANLHSTTLHLKAGCPSCCQTNSVKHISGKTERQDRLDIPYLNDITFDKADIRLRIITGVIVIITSCVVMRGEIRQQSGATLWPAQHRINRILPSQHHTTIQFPETRRHS